MAMINQLVHQWFCGVCLLLVIFKGDGFDIPITYLDSAVAKGAVCLDGSAPAYHFDKGFGDGINNWMILLQGGAWCSNATDCEGRAKIDLGSSRQMVTSIPFSGIRNNDSLFNPDFYNWNRMEVRYCDGASFTGDVEAVDPATNLHFRGARIFKAMVDELLAMGMNSADRVILTGGSAGGLAAIHNCDRLLAMLPSESTLKCVSDAGYFVNIRDITGAGYIEVYYDQLVATHGSAKIFPESCTSKLKPGLCFFPQYVVSLIQTPIFFVNAAYDSWQIRNILVPPVADPHGLWTACKTDIRKCSVDQMKTIQSFHADFLNSFKAAGTSPSKGFFINGCFTHVQDEQNGMWFRADSPKISGKSIANAVGDWVYDRSPFQMYGAPYPYDKTCHNDVKAIND